MHINKIGKVEQSSNVTSQILGRVRLDLLRDEGRQLHLQDGATQGSGLPPKTAARLLLEPAAKPSNAFAKVFRFLLLQLQRQKCSPRHHEQPAPVRTPDASQVRPQGVDVQAESEQVFLTKFQLL